MMAVDNGALRARVQGIIHSLFPSRAQLYSQHVVVGVGGKYKF
jgi:hypothetical protein